MRTQRGRFRSFSLLRPRELLFPSTGHVVIPSSLAFSLHERRASTYNVTFAKDAKPSSSVTLSVMNARPDDCNHSRSSSGTSIWKHVSRTMECARYTVGLPGHQCVPVMRSEQRKRDLGDCVCFYWFDRVGLIGWKSSTANQSTSSVVQVLWYHLSSAVRIHHKP